MGLQEWSASHWVGELGRALSARGYELSRFGSEKGMLAVKKGYWTGRIFPYTDFIFLVDLDSQGIADGASLEELHQAHRRHGEGQMRVPRPLRYRVPNSVTVGVTSGPVGQDVVDVANVSRHSVNSGEKNAVYVIDLSTETVYSQGLEEDRMSRYGGTWSPNVNPSNRFFRLLAEVIAEVMAPEADSSTGDIAGAEAG